MMQVNNKLLVVLLFFLFFAQFSVRAQDTVVIDEVDYLSLSLDEIMDVTVTTASKKEAQVSQEPDVITIVSQEEIALFGANSLLEVLERVVSVYTPYSYVFPNQNVALRGDYPNHLNPHLLYLINGRPFRELTMGGQNGSLLYAFPIESIDRIEIIRGPGSVLYGTNAFTGVVNIKTKQGKKELEANGELKVGSFKYKEVVAALRGKSKEVSWSTTTQVDKNEGWPFKAYLDATNYVDEKMYKENVSTMNTVKYKDFSAQLYYAKTILNSLTSRDFSSQVYHDNRMLVDVGYEKKKGELLNLNVNTTFNSMDNSITNDSITAFTFVGKDVLFEAYNYFYLPKHFSFVLGANANRTYNERENAGNPIIPFEAYWWYSTYGQVEYLLARKLTLNVGVQANKIHNIDWDFVPRVGGVYFITSKIGIKANYGQAFRSPTISETESQNKPFVLGNASLTPEKVTSFNGQVFYYTSKWEAQLTYFKNKQHDIITRETAPEGSGYRQMYINGDKHVFEGIEAESKYKLDKKWFFTGNYSYQFNRQSLEGEEKDNATLIPNHMFKVGASYLWHRGVEVGLYNNWVGRAYEVEGSAQVNQEITKYNLLTGNVNVDLKRLLKLDFELGIKMYVYNLLDEDIRLPDHSNAGKVNSVPGKPERSYYLTLCLGL